MAEHVPTALELVAMGLAEPDRIVPKGATPRIWISDEGHALLGTTLRANGARARHERQSSDNYRPDRG